MVKCNQICPWNYYEIGCKKPENELCPMSNLARKEKPKTNADRIRAMSDEELADWLARTQIDHVAEALKIACIPWEQHPDLRELTAKDNLEWLKQTAEEGADNG